MLLRYLTVKLKMFFGSLLWADDNDNNNDNKCPGHKILYIRNLKYFYLIRFLISS